MYGTVESKLVRLGEDKFLTILTEPGMCWYGYPLDTEITVVAVEGGIGDWAAYLQVPWIRPEQTAAQGDKLPKETAEEMFSRWAKKYTWRY